MITPMIDLLIILAFVVYSVANGFRHRAKASRNLEEYFLAGRTIKGWRAGVSLAATQFAADTPLLVVGLIATAGVFMLWRLWIYGLGFLLIGFLFGGPWRRAQVITDAELTEMRYSGGGVLALRALKAIYYGTVMNCAILAMVLVAASRISEVFLQWHNWLPTGLFQTIRNWVMATGIDISSGATALPPDVATTNNVISILVILAFTGLYSMTGGLRAVIATDTMQFTLAMVGTIIYAGIIMFQYGGPGAMVDQLVELYGRSTAAGLLSFTPNTRELVIPFLVIVSLQWLFERNSDGTGYFAQRMMACETDRDARIAAVVFTWLQIFLRSLVWLIIGVGLLLVYPYAAGEASGETFVAGRELLYATGIRDLLPVGVIGLALTGLLAALASTVDTHLTWGAGYWSNDLYLRVINRAWLKREPKNPELVAVSRLSNVVILLIALIVMANLGSIQTAWNISLLFGAGTGAVLILRWVWERINLYSEITAIAVSLVLAPVLLYFVREDWLRLILMSAISTTTVVVVTLLTPRTKQEVLSSFYEKSKPPGFWTSTARALGKDYREPLRNLGRGLYMTVTMSLSVYLLLYGCGRLLFPDPEGTVLLPIISTILGVASIGLWWKKLR